MPEQFNIDVNLTGKFKNADEIKKQLDNLSITPKIDASTLRKQFSAESLGLSTVKIKIEPVFSGSSFAQLNKTLDKLEKFKSGSALTSKLDLGLNAFLKDANKVVETLDKVQKAYRKVTAEMIEQSVVAGRQTRLNSPGNRQIFARSAGRELGERVFNDITTIRRDASVANISRLESEWVREHSNRLKQMIDFEKRQASAMKTLHSKILTNTVNSTAQVQNRKDNFGAVQAIINRALASSVASSSGGRATVPTRGGLGVPIVFGPRFSANQNTFGGNNNLRFSNNQAVQTRGNNVFGSNFSGGGGFAGSGYTGQQGNTFGNTPFTFGGAGVGGNIFGGGPGGSTGANFFPPGGGGGNLPPGGGGFGGNIFGGGGFPGGPGGPGGPLFNLPNDLRTRLRKKLVDSARTSRSIQYGQFIDEIQKDIGRQDRYILDKLTQERDAVNAYGATNDPKLRRRLSGVAFDAQSKGQAARGRKETLENSLNVTPLQIKRAQRSFDFANPEEYGGEEQLARTIARSEKVPLNFLLRDQANKSKGFRSNKFFESSRLNDPETIIQLGFSAAYGGLPSFLAAAAGGSTRQGAGGAVFSSTIVQAINVGLIEPLKQAFEGISHDFQEAGLVFQRSILGIASINQSNFDVVGTNGGSINPTAGLQAQQGIAKQIQLQARGKLLPLGIAGSTESTFVQGIVSALSQRGISASPEQVGRIAELLGGAIQTQRPGLLENTSLLLRDVQDVIGGGPQATRTILSQLIRPALGGLKTARTGTEVVSALENGGLGAFAEAAKTANNPAAVFAKLTGAIDNLKTLGGDKFLERLTPAIERLFGTLSDAKTIKAIESVGDAFGSVAGILTDLDTNAIEFGTALSGLIEPLKNGLQFLSSAVGPADKLQKGEVGGFLGGGGLRGGGLGFGAAGLAPLLASGFIGAVNEGIPQRAFGALKGFTGAVGTGVSTLVEKGGSLSDILGVSKTAGGGAGGALVAGVSVLVPVAIAALIAYGLSDLVRAVGDEIETESQRDTDKQQQFFVERNKALRQKPTSFLRGELSKFGLEDSEAKFNTELLNNPIGRTGRFNASLNKTLGLAKLNPLAASSSAGEILQAFSEKGEIPEGLLTILKERDRSSAAEEAARFIPNLFGGEIGNIENQITEAQLRRKAIAADQSGIQLDIQAERARIEKQREQAPETKKFLEKNLEDAKSSLGIAGSKQKGAEAALQLNTATSDTLVNKILSFLPGNIQLGGSGVQEAETKVKQAKLEIITQTEKLQEAQKALKELNLSREDETKRLLELADAQTLKAIADEKELNAIQALDDSKRTAAVKRQLKDTLFGPGLELAGLSAFTPSDAAVKSNLEQSFLRTQIQAQQTALEATPATEANRDLIDSLKTSIVESQKSLVDNLFRQLTQQGDIVRDQAKFLRRGPLDSRFDFGDRTQVQELRALDLDEAESRKRAGDPNQNGALRNEAQRRLDFVIPSARRDIATKIVEADREKKAEQESKQENLDSARTAASEAFSEEITKRKQLNVTLGQSINALSAFNAKAGLRELESINSFVSPIQEFQKRFGRLPTGNIPSEAIAAATAAPGSYTSEQLQERLAEARIGAAGVDESTRLDDENNQREALKTAIEENESAIKDLTKATEALADAYYKALEGSSKIATTSGFAIPLDGSDTVPTIFNPDGSPISPPTPGFDDEFPRPADGVYPYGAPFPSPPVPGGSTATPKAKLKAEVKLKRNLKDFADVNETKTTDTTTYPESPVFTAPPTFKGRSDLPGGTVGASSPSVFRQIFQQLGAPQALPDPLKVEKIPGWKGASHTEKIKLFADASDKYNEEVDRDADEEYKRDHGGRSAKDIVYVSDNFKGEKRSSFPIDQFGLGEAFLNSGPIVPSSENQGLMSDMAADLGVPEAEDSKSVAELKSTNNKAIRTSLSGQIPSDKSAAGGNALVDLLKQLVISNKAVQEAIKKNGEDIVKGVKDAITGESL